MPLFNPKGRVAKKRVRIDLQTGAMVSPAGELPELHANAGQLPQLIAWVRTGSAKMRRSFFASVAFYKLNATPVDVVGQAVHGKGSANAGKPVFDTDGNPVGQRTAYAIVGPSAGLDYMLKREPAVIIGYQAIAVRVPYMGSGACDSAAERQAKVKAKTAKRADARLAAKDCSVNPVGIVRLAKKIRRAERQLAQERSEHIPHVSRAVQESAQLAEHAAYEREQWAIRDAQFRAAHPELS